MQYVSTRGDSTPRTFSDILYEGFAPDDGLYLPQSYPHISREQLCLWKGLSYPSLAYEIFRLFAPEVPRELVWRLVNDTYQGDNFPNRRDWFRSDAVTPVTWLRGDDGIGLLELSNGPSLAFDDVAMQFLARLFDERDTKASVPLNLIGASTGDMGAAAQAAFADREGVKLILLSPKGRMSDFQAAQLYSCQAKNVYNIEVDGTFDNCQDIVNTLLKDREYAARHHLKSINSVLWARILMQVVYYFHAYLEAVNGCGEEIVFVVPAGNFGNAFAAWVAKMMGLPVMKLIISTNENDAMDAFFRTGRYHPKPSNETIATSSPSADISRAANFERFLFEVLGRDATRVRELMHDLEEKGEFELTKEEFQKLRLCGATSGTSNHSNRLEMIEWMHLEYDMFVDPHTADTLFCGVYMHPVGVKTICVETVSPVKFAPMVKMATGATVELLENFADIYQRPVRKVTLPDQLDVIRAEIDRITAQ